MEKMFKTTHKKFLDYYFNEHIKDVKSWLGVPELNISEKLIRKFTKMYYSFTFVEFWNKVRLFISLKKPMKIFEIDETIDTWFVWYVLSFLENENLIKIKDGKVVDNADLKKYFIPILPEREIIKKLKKPKLNQPIYKIFGKKFNFKPKLDQLPISIGSAVKVISRITRYYPFYDGFLFLGDDDFLSLLLSKVIPEMKLTAADYDAEVLDLIKRNNENIKTVRVDFRKKKKIKGEFFGFITNPPYTEEGAKTFLDFGINQLSEFGGRVFLEIGDEAILHRRINLMKFFAKKNLEIIELNRGIIKYPKMMIHGEDKIVDEKMKKMLGPKHLGKSFMLTADLYVMNLVPWKILEIKKPKNIIYSYI